MSDPQANVDRPVAAAIGEALFDCFPDRTILGGAPLNFAAHLAQLLGACGKAFAVSRVGDDRLGVELLRQLQTRHLPTDFIQFDERHPTGQVRVEITPTGEPKYEIIENVAWDHIGYDDALERLAGSCQLVCFGTLAQRSMESRVTIQNVLQHAKGAIRLLDVNLRPPFVIPEILESSLSAANVVKLNDEELAVIARLLPIAAGNANSVDEQARTLLDAFDLRLLALTRGPRGTVLYTRTARLEDEPIRLPPAPGADGVGAGDACSAGLAYGLLRRWPLEKTLTLANHMGAFVASQPGGTPHLPHSILDLAAAQSASIGS